MNAHAPRRQAAAFPHAGEEDHFAFAQERDPVANTLDFGQHMGGHEDGRAAAFDVREQAVERLLHERIEALGGLVQNQQGRVRLEGLDDSQFALHAGAVLTQPPPQVAARQFQSVAEFLPVSFVHRLPVEAGEEIERFKPRQVEVKPQFSGQVADSRPGVEALGPAVVTEDERFAAGGPEQIEQETDGRGLARAIEPEEAKTLAPARCPG